MDDFVKKAFGDAENKVNMVMDAISFCDKIAVGTLDTWARMVGPEKAETFAEAVITKGIDEEVSDLYRLFFLAGMSYEQMKENP